MSDPSATLSALVSPSTVSFLSSPLEARATESGAMMTSAAAVHDMVLPPVSLFASPAGAQVPPSRSQPVRGGHSRGPFQESLIFSSRATRVALPANTQGSREATGRVLRLILQQPLVSPEAPTPAAAESAFPPKSRPAKARSLSDSFAAAAAAETARADKPLCPPKSQPAQPHQTYFVYNDPNNPDSPKSEMDYHPCSCTQSDQDHPTFAAVGAPSDAHTSNSSSDEAALPLPPLPAATAVVHEVALSQLLLSPEPSPATAAAATYPASATMPHAEMTPSKRKQEFEDLFLVDDQIHACPPTPKIQRRGAVNRSQKSIDVARSAAEDLITLPNGKSFRLQLIGHGEYKRVYILAENQERFSPDYPNDQIVIKTYNLDSAHISLNSLHTYSLNQMRQSRECLGYNFEELGISCAYILNQDPCGDGFLAQRKITASERITPEAFVQEVSQVKSKEDIGKLSDLSQDLLKKMRAFFTMGTKMASPLDLSKLNNVIFEDGPNGITPTLIDFYEDSDCYKEEDEMAPFTQIKRGLKCWSGNNPIIAEYYLQDIMRLKREGNEQCNLAMNCYGTLIQEAAPAAAAAAPAPAAAAPLGLPLPDLHGFR